MSLLQGEARRMVRPRRLDAPYAPRIEPLEDRFLLSICHVKRLADNNGGHDLGNGHLRGTLRFCINHANSNPGPDTIDISATGTIQLTSQLPSLTSDITIIGPGADLVAVSGLGRDTPYPWNIIFTIGTGATVTISDLTITKGYYGVGSASGVRNYGTLTLKDCAVTENYSEFALVGMGGGISNSGFMTISGCTISGNEAVFSDDDTYGAGIFNSSTGVMQIQNSTISGNRLIGGGYGGGIFNQGTLDIRFSTLTNNSGASTGKGAGIHSTGTLSLYNTIVAGNKAWNGSSGPDVVGSYTGSANLIGGDPMLGPLQYNGGHTQTHALLPGSPALDAGDNTDAPEFDQRGPGFPRIVNGTIDIGAFEVQSTPLPSPRATSPTRGFELFTLFLGTADLDSLD